MPVKDTVQNYPIANVPWIAEIVKNRSLFFVPDVEELPHSLEKEELQRQQVRSVVKIPFSSGNSFQLNAILTLRDVMIRSKSLFLQGIHFNSTPYESFCINGRKTQI